MEEHTRFLRRLENGYDIPDIRYLEWLEVCYPKDTNTYQPFDETLKSDEGSCCVVLYLHVYSIEVAVTLYHVCLYVNHIGDFLLSPNVHIHVYMTVFI